MSHQCDATGCPAAVASGKFMCSRHWRMVPRPVQTVINDRYRACRHGLAFLRDIAYLEAAVIAVDHCAAVDGKEGRNVYARLLAVEQARQGPGITV